MSIPKEPRQLMINLMYLVLTAMLALNVSAEIINAFFALNKGIVTSNAIVDKSNIAIKNAIDKQVEAYNNPLNQGFKKTSETAADIVKDFESYIAGVTSTLITRAGGPNPKYKDGRPIRYKDKDVTTNYFLKENKGAEIEKKIKETRDKLLGLFTDPKMRAEMEPQIALALDVIPEDSKVKTWPELKFKQMPVAAVMPMLTKLVADAKTSQTAILNKMLEQVGGKEIKFDQFKVAIAPKNGYVIKGETFEADVYLAAFSSNPGTDVTISMNGTNVALKDGVGNFKRTEGNIGKQTVKATARIKNPMTGEVKTAEDEFSYEVGQRSAALSADKMNVIYIGVENPISVAVAGASSNDVKVSGSGINLSGSGTKYTATATTANNDASITVSAPGITQKFPFRVKRIPDPVPIMGGGPNKKGGLIGSGEIKAQAGIIAMLENFDFEAKCSIQSFELTRVRKNEDAVSAPVSGPRFEGKSLNLIQAAKPGDSFLFDDITARCPGDNVGRKIGSLAFRVR